MLGAEDTFLDGSTAVPFRYARKAESAGGAYGDDGDTTSTTVVPYLVAEALYRDDEPATWYPKVEAAEASITAGVLTATAQVTGGPEEVVVWAAASEDRRWSEIDLVALGVEDQVIAWYVGGRNTLAIGQTTLTRKDGSPVRFLQEPVAGDCSDVTPRDFCAEE